MPLPPIVAVEIGTSKTLALVGEMREDGFIMITGMGEYPSLGVRKGEVVDLENAATCVRSVIEAAEESGKVSIRQAHLAVSGGHVQSLVNRGSAPVLDKDGEITREDIRQVMELAGAINLPTDREALHTICRHFRIDDQEMVLNPEGMEGAKLSVDMLIVHGVRNRLRNAVKVVQSVPVGVADVAFSGICSALAVLTAEQKKSGVVVIDIGAGTTDYLAYENGVAASAGAIGVGGDHVTNDIAMAFNIPASQAERLKRDSGSAVVEHADMNQRISLPPEMGFPGRSVSLRSLHTVINARLEETFVMVRKHLETQKLLRQMGAGVVLVGGCGHQRGITKLAGKVFGLPCSVGKPRGVSGLATATEGPQYATAVGMVHYGFRTISEQRGAGGGFKMWLKKLFAGLSLGGSGVKT